MKRAELEALSLEELHQVARARGLVEAAGLPREALIEHLVTDHAPAHATGVAAPAPPARRGSGRAGSGEQRRAGGAGPAPADPGAKGQPTARRLGPGIPSGVVPGRPQEHHTESMARLYLDQRDFARAAELFRELLQLHPDDGALQESLRAAERAIAEPGPAHPPAAARPAPEPIGMLDLEEPPEHYGIDECEVLFKDPHYVFIYWEATDHGLAAARRDLGEEAREARLVIRIFSQLDRAERGLEREQRDHGVDWAHGRRYFPVPRAGARVRAAVGLVTPSGLFAPIAHSSQVRVPPSEPAPTYSTEWMEVTPARTRGLTREPVGPPVRGTPSGERPLPEPGSGEPADPGALATPLGGGSERFQPPRPVGSSLGGPAGSEGPPSSPTSPWRWRPGSQS